MHIPDGFARVLPYLFVDDAETYISFLKNALGGEEVGRTLAPDGRIANSQVRFGDATIMISQASSSYPASRSAMYLYVDDADAAMRRALDNDAALEMDVADMPYGDRQGGIRDPGGNIWWISERLTATPYHST